MSEIKMLLSRALPDELPVPSVDRDSVIAAGRRAGRRRRVARGVAGVLAVAGGLTVGAVAMAATRPESPARPGTAALVVPSVTSTSAGGCPAEEYLVRGGVCLPRTVADPTEPADQGAPRLTTALRDRLAKVQPGATLAADPMMPGRPPLAFAGTTGHYKAGAFVTVGSRTGRINVAVTTGTPLAPGGRQTLGKGESSGPPPSPQPLPPAAVDPCTERVLADGHRPDCRSLAGPDGESINVYTVRGDAGGIVSNNVDLYRRDGTRIVLWVSNSRNATDDDLADEPAFTVDQVAELALAPGLTLYP